MQSSSYGGALAAPTFSRPATLGHASAVKESSSNRTASRQSLLSAVPRNGVGYVGFVLIEVLGVVQPFVLLEAPDDSLEHQRFRQHASVAISRPSRLDRT